MARLILVLSVATITALSFGCSDDTEQPPPKDTGVRDKAFDDMKAADGSEPCGPSTYPCGPYGTLVGDIAANLEFLGFSDANNHCKAHKDKVMDATARKVAFKDWWTGSASCPTYQKKVLWVMVSAGWCTPCINEVQSTQKQYAAGGVDHRIGILNLVFETKNHGEPADTNFAKTWYNAYGLTYPVAADPSFKMGAYFNKKATPFNMLVEVKSGKIQYEQVGGDISDVGKKATELVNK